MIVIYQAENLQDAELLRHRLEAAGIQSMVRNGFLQGALGELPLSVRPEVCVGDEAQVTAARAVVVEFEGARARDTGEEVACPSCGEDNPINFELCWKCRADLSA